MKNVLLVGLGEWGKVIHRSLKQIKSIKKKNNIYVVHDEESGVTHSTLNTVKNFLNIRSSNQNINLIDKFC